jgi:hypothetical protein
MYKVLVRDGRTGRVKDNGKTLGFGSCKSLKQVAGYAMHLGGKRLKVEEGDKVELKSSLSGLNLVFRYKNGHLVESW